MSFISMNLSLVGKLFILAFSQSIDYTFTLRLILTSFAIDKVPAVYLMLSGRCQSFRGVVAGGQGGHGPPIFEIVGFSEI